MPGLQLGVHIGQQDVAMDAVRELWRTCDAAMVDWISVWDHLYESPPAGGVIAHYEAVACLGALAADTSHARIGCLVFYVGYRNPGLLAKSAVTLDHISGGRFELGIGGGWYRWEAEAFGYDFPEVGPRLDMLDEAAGLLRSYLTTERTTHEGEHFRSVDASMLPRPVRGHMPLWIGGIGEKRTLRTVARRATGWNATYVSPREFARLGALLDRYCAEIGRDPESIERSVKLFDLGIDRRSAAEIERAEASRWGAMWERVSRGALLGTPETAIGRIMEYRDAGADLVTVVIRTPIDPEVVDAYLSTAVPATRSIAD